MIFFNLLLYFIFFFLVDFGGISIACVAGYCYLSIQTSRTDPKITPLRLHLQPHLTSSALALQPHLVHHLLIFTSPPSLIAFFFFLFSVSLRFFFLNSSIGFHSSIIGEATCKSSAPLDWDVHHSSGTLLGRLLPFITAGISSSGRLVLFPSCILVYLSVPGSLFLIRT